MRMSEHNKNISRADRKKYGPFEPGGGSACGDLIVSQFEFPWEKLAA
jgi:hypothetical protein